MVEFWQQSASSFYFIVSYKLRETKFFRLLQKKPFRKEEFKSDWEFDVSW